MLLKTAIGKQHKLSIIALFTYRLPLQIKEVLLFASGDSYPICPRCENTVDREYMNFCECCGQKLSWDFFDSAQIINAPRGRG